MTLWEFACAVEGWRSVHQSEKPAPPAMDNERLADLGIEGF